MHTSRAMGWADKANGALLRLAAAESFDAVITLDLNMQFQQNPSTLPLPVIILAPERQGEEGVAQLLTGDVAKLLAQGAEKRFYRFGRGRV